MSTEDRLLVRQQKGVAGRPWTQRLVLKGLGLRGPGSEVVVANERAIRGMIRKVLHLVSVDSVAAGTASSSKSAGTKSASAKAGTSKSGAAKAGAAKSSSEKEASAKEPSEKNVRAKKAPAAAGTAKKVKS
jgi:large subunit ribosomal protein L30